MSPLLLLYLPLLSRGLKLLQLLVLAPKLLALRPSPCTGPCASWTNKTNPGLSPQTQLNDSYRNRGPREAHRGWRKKR